ncbi:helix-turn-helix domain-containing protein [Metabacillus fastidiosus]|uniref:Helix-turn-helix transcriptional regulator n=1 Tax=Metabacillus fastidiosus TaxID=1458 RepID=A0ABU6NW54_9BACI|nr:helix-turn-helix transcriptional regulator [Metabacillus fastidiosus]MED4401363.1 helix-turn-helix transcriptional regulator [Metabacillus fastidiosus]MED4463000.1 helix-turn-helix transcriptional regulator [Metabacillus fastidiosus]
MRQSVQMTQRQLGEAIGFERRTIMNWENGKSSPFDVYAVIESIRKEIKLRINDRNT